jgi:ribosomal protein L28
MSRYDGAAVMVECVLCGQAVPWGAAFRASLTGITRRVWLCELCYFCWAEEEETHAEVERKRA